MGPLTEVSKKAFALTKDKKFLQDFLNEIESNNHGRNVLEFCEALSTINEDQVGTGNFLDEYISAAPLYDSQEMAITLFYMSKGTAFPLHDHPHMLGISHFILGNASFYNYNKIRSDRQFFELDLLKSGEATSGSTLFLTEKLGNLHSIQALENTVMLDIFVPNYSSERVCNFYREFNPGKYAEYTPQFNFRYIDFNGIV